MRMIESSGRNGRPHRRGVIAPLLAVLLIPMLGIVAFAIDYGYLVHVRSELQRSADACALAAVQDLVPDAAGHQDFPAVRQTVRDYALMNLVGSTALPPHATAFQVRDEDIEIGRYDPATIYSGSVQLFDDGIRDTVRVTLRRDGISNSPVRLFFAQVFGIASQSIEVTAAAVLRRGRTPRVGADILPYAVPAETWDALGQGESFAIYSGNQILDSYGSPLSGNWGTVDIGYENNSTSDLSNQILNGLTEDDLQQLIVEGRLPPDADSLTAPIWFDAETGLSVGQKAAVRAIHGQTRIIPIYDQINGDPWGDQAGDNAQFHIIAWGVVEVTTSSWLGTVNTHVTVTKSYAYDGSHVPNDDLANPDFDVIPNAYTSPVLIE